MGSPAAARQRGVSARTREVHRQPSPATRTRLSPQTPSRYALRRLRRQPRLPITGDMRRHQRQNNRRDGAASGPSRRGQSRAIVVATRRDSSPLVRHVPRSDLTVPFELQGPGHVRGRGKGAARASIGAMNRGSSSRASIRSSVRVWPQGPGRRAKTGASMRWPLARPARPTPHATSRSGWQPASSRASWVVSRRGESKGQAAKRPRRVARGLRARSRRPRRA